MKCSQFSEEHINIYIEKKKHFHVPLELIYHTPQQNLDFFIQICNISCFIINLYEISFITKESFNLKSVAQSDQRVVDADIRSPYIILTLINGAGRGDGHRTAT